MSLRTDERQWLIYGEEQQGAVMRALEAWALKVCGTLMANSKLKPIRGIGNFMMRVADTRLTYLKREGGAKEVAADWVLLASRYAADPDRTPWTPDIERALSELYAVVFHIDSRANAAGFNGDGVHRIAVKGD